MVTNEPLAEYALETWSQVLQIFLIIDNIIV